ncbi:restriction endonuclease subunit S, partial [bacterium]|nr:restriction endonuclease subunit S [bacterium]
EIVDFFDFCVLQRGYDLPLSKQEEGKFPIVTSAGIAAHHSEFKVKAPGVLVGRSGSIGKVFYIEEDFWPHNTTLYVKDFNGNFPRYVYYYLLMLKAHQFSRSTAVPTLNRNNLRGLKVEVPSYKEQKQIVIKIEELMVLCDELDARQRKQGSALLRLNNAALDRLLNARKPEVFAEIWQQISDNFDLLYDAPESVNQLRQAVQQLGVQGKLEPQDANDEPASLLLERIRTEKEKLVKEKKINKSEPLPPIDVDKVPFELPRGWVWVRLGNAVSKIQIGPFGSLLHKSDYIQNGIPLVNPIHIKNERIVASSKLTVDSKTLERLKIYVMRSGDIVMGRRG